MLDYNRETLVRLDAHMRANADLRPEPLRRNVDKKLGLFGRLRELFAEKKRSSAHFPETIEVEVPPPNPERLALSWVGLIGESESGLPRRKAPKLLLSGRPLEQGEVTILVEAIQNLSDDSNGTTTAGGVEFNLTSASEELYDQTPYGIAQVIGLFPAWVDSETNEVFSLVGAYSQVMLLAFRFEQGFRLNDNRGEALKSYVAESGVLPGDIAGDALQRVRALSALYLREEAELGILPFLAPKNDERELLSLEAGEPELSVRKLWARSLLSVEEREIAPHMTYSERLAVDHTLGGWDFQEFYEEYRETRFALATFLWALGELDEFPVFTIDTNDWQFVREIAHRELFGETTFSRNRVLRSKDELIAYRNFFEKWMMNFLSGRAALPSAPKGVRVEMTDELSEFANTRLGVKSYDIIYDWFEPEDPLWELSGMVFAALTSLNHLCALQRTDND